MCPSPPKSTPGRRATDVSFTASTTELQKDLDHSHYMDHTTTLSDGTRRNSQRRCRNDTTRQPYAVHVTSLWFLVLMTTVAMILSYGAGRFSRQYLQQQVVSHIPHVLQPHRHRQAPNDSDDLHSWTGSNLVLPRLVHSQEIPQHTHSSKYYHPEVSRNFFRLVEDNEQSKCHDTMTTTQTTTDDEPTTTCPSNNNRATSSELGATSSSLSAQDTVQDVVLDMFGAPPGQHLLVDIEHVDGTFLDSEQDLATAMIDLITHATNITLLSYHCHGLYPIGVTCIGLAMGSHISFHTWPENGVITLDLFTWGPSPLMSVIPAFTKYFGVPNRHMAHPPTPHAKWAYKKRGFDDYETEEASHTNELFFSNSVLGNMETEKIIVTSVQSDFQRMDILDVLGDVKSRSRDLHLKSLSHDGSYESQHPEFYQQDRILFIDHVVQSRGSAEAAYHEALVHPLMFVNENPKRVAIVGGGEGAILREVLKHETVEQVVMIEIDPAMVQTSRQYLPSWNDCSNLVDSADCCFDDARVEIVYEDAIAWFVRRESPDLFDVIIMDTLESGPGSLLEQSEDVYQNKELVSALYRSLSPGGVVSIQVGGPSKLKGHPTMEKNKAEMLDLLVVLEEAGFASILDYDESQGRFAAPWSFLAVMKEETTRAPWFGNEADMNLAIQKRSKKTKDGRSPFSYFDGATMMSYKFPTRIHEEIWCHRNPSPETCQGHGYDPERQNFPAASFEVKKTSASDGPMVLPEIFAKERIPKGSYIDLDECVNRIYVGPSTFGLLHRLAVTNQQTPALDLVNAFGSVGVTYGAESAIVDGIRASIGNTNGTVKTSVYDPYAERHFPLDSCVRSLQEIEVGESVVVGDRHQ